MLFTAIELFAVFISVLVFAFYLYYRHCFTYWKNKGVPQLNPVFPVGDLSTAALGQESIFLRLEHLYNSFKKAGHKFGGIYFFNGPVYFPVHPDLIKSVLQSDFHHFSDRGLYLDEEKVPLSPSLFTLPIKEWKRLRIKLSPTFTSGKMKSMYKIFVQACQNLITTLQPFIGEEVDITSFMLRFTTDIIGSTAFGVDCNSVKNPNTEFSRNVAKIFKVPFWKLLKLMTEEGLQNPGNIMKVLVDNKKIEKYFGDMVRDTIEYRDKNKIIRNDFLNLLMEMRSEGITLKEIISQAFSFFIAGFETSSTVLSFCLHELAHNQDIQQKLRGEIRNLGTNSSKFAYKDVLSLPYLDKCIKETLRKYPVISMFNRICVQAYQIPDSDVVIDEGTPVIISPLALHRDPDYFPDPLKFHPDRFNFQQEFVPFTYLPFGDGPRNCIGMRFGMMQVKLGIATLINEYQFFPSLRTPRELVVEPSTTSVVLSASGGVYSRIIKA